MSGRLIDAYQRIIDYLRVSITDLCNLRCLYCMPREGVRLVDHQEILTYEEILAFIAIARDMGVRKLRITGGEPLVRRGVIGFIAELHRIEGIEDIGLTTNGVLLASMARDLRRTGLNRINVSLDSLRRETFQAITGSDRLDEAKAGIRAALREGFNPVKINVVLLEGINEADVPSFAGMTMDFPVDVRFIERMPFGNDSEVGSVSSFSALQAVEMIRREFGELEPVDRSWRDGPASMFRLRGAAGRIGVIDAMTGHFCRTCNRLRLTARGTLRPCLLGREEIDVKTALRERAGREQLAEIILQAVRAKPIGHQACPDCFNEGMNLVGG